MTMTVEFAGGMLTDLPTWTCSRCGERLSSMDTEDLTRAALAHAQQHQTDDAVLQGLAMDTGGKEAMNYVAAKPERRVMLDGLDVRAAIGMHGDRPIYAEEEWLRPGSRGSADMPPRQIREAFGDLVSTVKALHGVIDDLESCLSIVMSPSRGGPEDPSASEDSPERFGAPLASDLDGVGKAVSIAKRRLLAMLERVEV